MGMKTEEFQALLASGRARGAKIQGGGQMPQLDAPPPPAPRKGPSAKVLLGGYDSRWERDYAARLNLRKHLGEVVDVLYQRVTYKLADDTRYTPDFVVILAGGRVEHHEVKGQKREDAMVKFKVAAEQMCSLGAFVMVTKDDGSWVEIKRYEQTGGQP